jgi:predicted nuclease of predicted toxin-antitoxin system
VRFLVDEPVSPRVADRLRQAGHDAVHAREIGLTASPDAAILERARTDARIVVTQDHDFGTLLTASGAGSPSVIRLRLRDARAESHARAILDNLARIQTALREGALVVLSDGAIRIRHLPVR